MSTYTAKVPSLALYIGGKLVKFVAGKLTVEDEHDDEVMAFAEGRSHYGIEKVEAGESTETEDQTPKRETVDEVIERVDGDADAAQEALDAELASDSPRTTLVSALEAMIEAAEADETDENENQA